MAKKKITIKKTMKKLPFSIEALISLAKRRKLFRVLSAAEEFSYHYDICCDCGLRHLTFVGRDKKGNVFQVSLRDSLGTDSIRLIRKSKYQTKARAKDIFEFLTGRSKEAR